MNQEKHHTTQKFQVLTSSGESLIKFTYCQNNRPRPLKISKSKTLYVSTDNRTTDTEVHIGCPLKRAPNNQTFLIYPENNKTKFYLSLNHIINSLRFTDENKRNVRKDDFLNVLCSTTKKISLIDIQICLYSLYILIKKPLQKYKDIDDLISKVRLNQKEFVGALSSSRPHNEIHKPISRDTYKKFKDAFTKTMSENITEDVPESISTLFFSCIFDEEKDIPKKVREKLKKLTKKNQDISQEILKTLDGTSVIMNDVLTPYPNENESGHMAIIRVPSVEDGKRFKQTLCIAKMKARIYELEIIQDFNGEHTTLDKHYDLAVKDAKANECPEHLRILKRIQGQECEKLNAKGGRACSCSNYLKDKSNIYNMKCLTCGHIHKSFNSYADLIR